MNSSAPSNIRISVIIPAYNAGLYIEETIRSVLSQTYKNFEIIVVDDGSTDNTIQVVEKFGDKVRLFKQENAGVSKARNFAVSQAIGEWIAFVDADDVWESDKLVVQVMGLGDTRWSHTNSLYIGENQDGTTSRSDLSKQYDGFVLSKLIDSNFITTSTVMMEKTLFLELGGFNESLEALEDWKLWIDASKVSKLSYQTELLCKYRVYSGSTSRKARHVLPIHLTVINLIYDGLTDEEKRLRPMKSVKANSYGICSYIAEDANDSLFACRCALGALVNDPFAFRRWKRVLRTLLSIRVNSIKK